MSSDVFILSAIRKPQPAEAVRLAVENAGVNASRIDDALIGLDGSASMLSVSEILSEAGLACPSVSISSSLRAVFFAAQSILSGDIELAVVLGVEAGGATALVLAASEAIGRWNLAPRARLAARSLAGPERAMRLAGIGSADVAIMKEGDQGARLISEVLDELEARKAQWGMVMVGDLVLVLERT